VSYLTRLGLALALGMISTTAWAGATASAFKKETKKGANYWNASSAIDGKLEPWTRSGWSWAGRSRRRSSRTIRASRR
jgi:hypothetical protein